MQIRRIRHTGVFRPAVCLVALAFAATGLAPLPAQAQTAALSTAEIERLVAPIALYPDPMIAEVLPASTYPDEVAAAADYVAQHGPTDKNIDKQGWDPSVAAIARYPEVLNKMADDMDWTADLGDTFLALPSEVMDAIQTCRGVAKERGALQTNDQQTVVYEEQNIRIVPTQDNVVYVPTYAPQVVYVEDDDDDVNWGGVVAAGAITFGVGMAVGAWMNSDCNWYHGGIYHPHYGGGYPSWNNYRGGGNININGDVNINRPVNNYNNVNNWNHDSNRYQNNINKYGDKYNNRYRDQNRAQNRDTVRNDKVSNAKRNPQQNRNNANTRNNAAARNNAASRDLTKPATGGGNRDRTTTGAGTRDASRGGGTTGGGRTRDTAAKTPAPDRAKKDAVDRQQMERDRQKRESASRGRDQAAAKQREAKAPQRDASRPSSYERGSSARKESDRGLQSRQQANPKASGAFGGGGSRPQPKMSGGGGGRGGGGGGSRGGGGGGGRGGGGGGGRGRRG